MRLNVGAGVDSPGLNPATPIYQLSFPNCKMGIIICLPDKGAGESSIRTHREIAPKMLVTVCIITLFTGTSYTHSFIHACIHSFRKHLEGHCLYARHGSRD